jgi:SAM-dependent methyltransferase
MLLGFHRRLRSAVGRLARSLGSPLTGLLSRLGRGDKALLVRAIGRLSESLTRSAVPFSPEDWDRLQEILAGLLLELGRAEKERLVRAIHQLGQPLADWSGPGHAAEEDLLQAIDLLSRPLVRDTSKDPFHLNYCAFLEEVKQIPDCHILELGARNSPTRQGFAGCRRFTGLDIHPGANVDVVGDAHRLTEYFPRNHFDAVFSLAVFEHLAQPWQVALEIARVLKPGGWVFIGTVAAWPPHARPWDFWRFSEHALRALLNPRLGFEVVRCNEGLPGMLVSLSSDLPTRGLYRAPANLAVSALARKVAEPDPALVWAVDTREFLAGTIYP